MGLKQLLYEYDANKIDREYFELMLKKILKLDGRGDFVFDVTFYGNSVIIRIDDQQTASFWMEIEIPL